ncbi:MULTISPECIES: ABC transporter ATP-binding protein [Georgenia]|uniref:ABC transporter ATP-binding protein n=1 Tax=Georgenia TaxID=154116 RepID=UPI001E3AC344|nr:MULTISPECIES: ABC transporter ATP-binding protein/permease [Georgenia]
MPLLPRGARRFLVLYAVATSSLALLDIAALGLLALTMTPLVQGRPLSLPLVGEVPPEYTVWIIVVVCVLIVLKSVLSMALQWIATRRFAAYELLIGDRLFAAYIQAPWTERLRRNSAELVRLADVGIANTTAGLLLPAASLPAEVVTFVAVLAVLVVAEPVTAAITLVYLGLIAAVLYFVISKRAVVAGRVNRDYSFRVATLMTEMVATLKEITLRNKAGEVAQVVHRNRIHTTRARANIQFLNAVPKFVIEAALIGGFVLVGAAAYLQGGSASALSAVALFAVAGFRMIPSVTRFQGIITTTSSTIPHANAVMRDIRLAERYTAGPEQIGTRPLRHRPEVLSLRDVEFTYPGSATPAVTGVDVDVRMGSSLALVGASGAGKSTLVDIFLGLLVPSSGSITIDGEPLVEVLADWRSKVGYVPQDVSLFDGTIAQNVALSWDGDVDEDRVREALTRAQLLEVVENRAGGLHARIGERGMALSGGQRQRLGIARALYSDPLVLVMDEATSALDTATEEAVARAIRDLHGDVTVISVAHRLSTIRHSDQVCFMRDARIVARGTFEEVVASEPDFAYQASLAGLA